jgi:hypothetical protein
MEEFADGRSVWGIGRRLNAEGILWPKSKDGKWTPDVVKRLLHNERYRSVNTFKLTSQTKNRDTGSVIKKPKPANEQLRIRHRTFESL